MMPPRSLLGADCVIGLQFLETVEYVGDVKMLYVKIKSLDASNAYDKEISQMMRMCVDTEAEQLVAPTEYLNELNKIRDYKPKRLDTPKSTMTISLPDETPVSQRLRRLAPKEQAVVDTLWHSRVCVDIRKLSGEIIRKHHPLPLIEDQLDRLTKGRIYVD